MPAGLTKNRLYSYGRKGWRSRAALMSDSKAAASAQSLGTAARFSLLPSLTEIDSYPGLAYDVRLTNALNSIKFNIEITSR